jgi:hypothetical protein
MSTKTTIKRTALGAVVALGFGMISVVPASAATTAINITKTAAATDSSIFVVAGTSSAVKATALAAPTKVYSSNATVALNDLTVAAPGGPAAQGTLSLLPSSAAGAVTADVATTLRIGSIRTTAAVTATALGTATGTTVGATAPTVLTASTAGTWYALYDDEAALVAGISAYTAGTDFVQFIVVYQTTSTTSITTAGTTAAPVAGINGQAGVYTVTYVSPNATDTVNPSFRITSAPVGSKILTNPLNQTYTAAGAYTALSSTTMVNGSAFFDGMSSPANVTGAVSAPFTGTLAGVAKGFYFWPDVAGTYTFTFFDDRNSNGLVDGSDVSAQKTIVVGAAATTIAVANLTGLAPTSATNPNASEYGAVIRIKATDAAGVGSAPSADGGVTVSISGSAKITYKNGTVVANVSTLTLGSADFDGSGYAYLNVADATAEVATITIAGTGTLATAAGASTTAQFVTATTGLQVVPGSGGTAGVTGTGFVATSVTDYKIPAGSTMSWESTVAASVSTAAASKYAAIQVVDTAKKILGSSMILSYDSAAATDTVYGSADFAVTTAKTTAGAAYDVISQTTVGAATATVTATVANPVITGTTVSFSPASGVRTALLASTTVTATVKDQFGNAVTNAAVTWSVSGRNVLVANPVTVTSSTGKASFTLTDAALSTVTTLADTITASVSYTDALLVSTTTSGTFTINYSNVGVKTVTVTTHNTTAGVANLAVAPQGIIQASTSGPSATAGRSAISATVADANGAVYAGVVCTWSVDGTGAAIPSTSVTSYTNGSGICTSTVYAWIAGTYTVTATAGGVSATGTESFYNADATSVRTISASTNGNTVTAIAKDRFGNPVAGATLYAITSGGANIGGLLISSLPVTDKNGSVSWVISGSGSVKVTTINPAGNGLSTDQSTAALGYVKGDVATPVVFTATTVGTTTTAETGVGASYAPVGVSSATVEVVNIESKDALDAAMEAIDAANAATDAANSAADAADAATAAAQDASDAVAELSTSVLKVIASLKKQLTALTNLVIKIQKKVKA